MIPVKVVLIVSDIEKSLQLEWVADGLRKRGFDLSFILLGETNTPFARFLTDGNFQVFKIRTRSRLRLIPAFWRTFFILLKTKPQVVHTHLTLANRVGLLAAWCLRIKKRIYTRHNTSFHHFYFPRSVWTDRVTNWLATDIIVLCEKGRTIVRDWERTSPVKIHLIPHGFDLTYFSSVEEPRIKSLATRYGIMDQQPVIGVVARYTHFKGIQFIIPAFRRLLESYPHAHLILANAQGDYALEIKKLLSELPRQSYTEINFEPDTSALYRLFTVYVHAPVNEYAEAFGQTYVEALACGIPCVFTLSGIACDFIRQEENALVSKHEDSESILQSMRRIISDPVLRAKLTSNGLKSIQPFNISDMIVKLGHLYIG